MKVIYETGTIKKKFRNPVLIIGIFDGVHLGHQKLIKKAIQRARAIHGQTIVLTFHPHPVHVLHPDVYLPLIVSLPLRLQMIESLGVDATIVIKFTREFSHLTPKQFVENFLMKYIHPQEVFVGDDFRFGKDRSGSLQYLKEEAEKFNFKINIVDSLKGERKKISSTEIRQYIADGQLYKARRLLGRNVMMRGTVIRGDSRGRLLGFPTANISPSHEVIPPVGVYAVRVKIGKKMFEGMSNIGHRPSFTSGRFLNVEVHVFEFNKNIYGQEIDIEFVKRIRNEKVFHSPDQLINQLKKDELKTKALLTKHRL